MKAEVLWAAQGIEGRLHLAEKGAALQDLLLQSFKVSNVADHMATVTVRQHLACLNRRQEI